jgi:hypothetical protein
MGEYVPPHNHNGIREQETTAAGSAATTRENDDVKHRKPPAHRLPNPGHQPRATTASMMRTQLLRKTAQQLVIPAVEGLGLRTSRDTGSA